MSIETKLEQFRQGALQVDRRLRPADLAQFEVRNVAGLRGAAFEPGTSMDSPFLNAGARGFLGAYSYMNDGGYIRGAAFIGRFTSVGRRVTIGAGRHTITGLSSSPALAGGPASRNYDAAQIAALGLKDPSSPRSHTEIGCDVWIGDGAIVMPGVAIGHGAVIGANAVVTRDVPPYAILVGAPGRVIRYRFPPDQIAALIESRWWNHPKQVLVERLTLGNIIACIDELARLGPPEGDYETFAMAQGT